MSYLSDFDITILAICAIVLLLCGIGNIIAEKCYRCKYKDQRVGVRTKWWRR